MLDLETRTLAFRGGTRPVEIPDGARGQLVEGSWNATAVLLEAGPAIDELVGRLPYVSGF